MLDGLKSTVIIALGALVIGVLMGTLVAIVKVRQNRGVIGWILSGIADIYIAIIRGTPVMVQLLLVYFGLLSPLGVSAMIVAILVFGPEQRRLCGGDYPQRYSGGGQGTDGSRAFFGAWLRGHHEQNYSAPGNQEHFARFRQ